MALTSGFFNSINHDRLYDAEQLSSIFDGLIIDGVYEHLGDAFMVTPNEGVNDSVIVGTGRAWFDHTWTLNDSGMVLSLPAPNTLYARNDFIVIDVDKTDTVRKNSIKVVSGTMGDNPQDPVLLDEELHKQYPIARVRVPAGFSSVVQAANIDYLVGTDKCPLVTGILETLNLTNWLAQYDAEFNDWFEGIRDIFDEDPMTAFQNQIDNLNNKIDAMVPYTTKSVFDTLVSGKNPFSVNITDINYTSAESHSYIDENFAANKIYDFILPDGKIAVVTFDDNGSTTSSQKIKLITRVYTKEGVQQSRQAAQVQNTSVPNSPRTSSWNVPWTICHVDVDSYPCKIIASNFMARNVNSAVVTIQESGTVSITNSSSTAIDSSYTGATFWVYRPAKLPDGRTFGISFGYRGSTNSAYVQAAFSTIDTNGSISVSANKYTKNNFSLNSSGGGLSSTYFRYFFTCFYTNGILYAKMLDLDGDQGAVSSGRIENVDKSSNLLMNTNIQNVVFKRAGARGDEHISNNVQFAIDPNTLGIIKNRFEGDTINVTGSYDSMYDLDYSEASSGTIKNMSYEYSTVPTLNNSESFKCINLSDSPNLLSVPYSVRVDNTNGEYHLSGMKLIKDDYFTSANLIKNAIGKDYSTGVEYTYSPSPAFKKDDDSGICDFYPYKFTARSIDGVLYILFNMRFRPAYADQLAFVDTMYTNPIAKLVKISDS